MTGRGGYPPPRCPAKYTPAPRPYTNKRQNVQLYLADWGYSTPHQRERALLNPRIRVLDQADFACMCRALDPSK